MAASGEVNMVCALGFAGSGCREPGPCDSFETICPRLRQCLRKRCGYAGYAPAAEQFMKKVHRILRSARQLSCWLLDLHALALPFSSLIWLSRRARRQSEARGLEVSSQVA